ncbi:MAG: hypothetical protein [Caudoviricetes sp.]|nr:MAG: hypothetical protein [Caudoviricetes sp.]
MKLLCKTVYGSKLYGTSTPESDTDYKGIFVPPLRDLLLQSAKTVVHQDTNNSGRSNDKNDVDCELYSLGKFVNMAVAGETAILDMLHTPKSLTLETSEAWEYLVAHRSEFYTTDMKAYLGYVRKQASKYGVKGTRLRDLTAVTQVIDRFSQTFTAFQLNEMKVGDMKSCLPVTEFTNWIVDEQTRGGTQTFYQVLGRKYQSTMSFTEFHKLINVIASDYGERARKAAASEGIDWKAISHAARGAMQLNEIYETGDLKFPLKECKLLTDIKTGKKPYSEVQELLESLVDDVERNMAVAVKNGMRKSVDRERWNDFVVKVYKELSWIQ